MDLQLNSISYFCTGLKLPDLLSVQYAPLPWITDMEPIVTSGNQHINNPQFMAGKTWLTLPLLPTARTWRESSDRSAQGLSYTQRIEGVTPKLRPDVTGTIAKMEKVRYVLRIADRVGQEWILGDLSHPFSFSAQASLRGQNQYDISFDAVTIRRAAGFTV